MVGEGGTRDDLDDDVEEAGLVGVVEDAAFELGFLSFVGVDRKGDERSREGLDCGGLALPFFSGVAGLTLIALLRFTCNAPL